MADIYLGFGEDEPPVHHTKSVRAGVNLDYGYNWAGHRPPLVGVEVLGVDRLSIDGRDFSHLLDKEKLAAKLQILGENMGFFPYVFGKKLYCDQAMVLAEQLLQEL